MDCVHNLCNRTATSVHEDVVDVLEGLSPSVCSMSFNDCAKAASPLLMVWMSTCQETPIVIHSRKMHGLSCSRQERALNFLFDAKHNLQWQTKYFKGFRLTHAACRLSWFCADGSCGCRRPAARPAARLAANSSLWVHHVMIGIGAGNASGCQQTHACTTNIDGRSSISKLH